MHDEQASRDGLYFDSDFSFDDETIWRVPWLQQPVGGQ
jgi:hypothetical protein